jgi:multidrug efflux pump subunit AcrA (membrane-fusion protein)
VEEATKASPAQPAQDASPSPHVMPEQPTGKFRRDDEIYMRDLKAALLTQGAPEAYWMLYVIAIILASLLTWAHYAKVDEVTNGQGRIIPASREQIIQSLEGGILEEMMVKEGEIVEKGQVLLRIDPTRAGASYREGMSKVVGLKGSIARLRAEAFQTSLTFPKDVMEFPSIVRDETQAYFARKRALEESIVGLQQALALAEKEVALASPLAAKGLYSDLDVLRAKRQVTDIRTQIADRINRYRADANAELVRMESELAQTRENVSAREDTMTRTTVRAPVRGTVKNIRVTTIGGVIAQGADIMEIVPLEDQLLIEAKVRPSDVAFLHPGLPAMVKISAYDFAIYGGLPGTLELISPDTLRDEKRAMPGTDDTYYRILVRTKTSVLRAGGKELPIIPGMTATVDIRTGQKTIMDYILKPVFKMKEAFRER